ncbi:hypothetical protein TWF696_003519 [Orbilia brochopaga]|uniref:BTB domain-containing protein n=1 Tax=Orbilia brochopaga TaxID=3140254 RepID=A0AAV9U103_9PEZI
MDTDDMFEDQENTPPASSASSNDNGDGVTAPEKATVQTTLQTILKEKIFTDTTIYVGEDSTPFHLHRAIISHHSEVFRVACTGPFVESVSGEIHLPSLDPEVFSVVVNWMYDGGLRIHDCSFAAVHGAYLCAEQLQMPALQAAIYNKVLAAVPWAGDGPPSERPAGSSGKAPSLPEWKEFEHLPSRGGRLEDKAMLKAFAERMADEGVFSRVTAKSYGTDTLGFAVFLAIHSRRIEKTLNKIACGMCQSLVDKDQTARIERCVICAEHMTRNEFLELSMQCEAKFKTGVEAGTVEMPISVHPMREWSPPPQH